MISLFYFCANSSFSILFIRCNKIMNNGETEQKLKVKFLSFPLKTVAYFALFSCKIENAGSL
jgi:hypothetical protein